MKNVDQIVEAEMAFGSNAIRLSMREWIIATVLVLILLMVLPGQWKGQEKFEPSMDYRLPYSLSTDYWVFNRLAIDARDTDKIVIIGDSVVWGEYVRPEKTLASALNEQEGQAVFVNGGVNGLYPLAIEGLVRHYAKQLRNTRVLLHCNLLWLSSAERDLSEQTKREVAFNHPRLVPQFSEQLAVYHASASERLGSLFERELPYRQLARHVQIAWFDNLDIPTWTIEHPYENPIRQIMDLPQPLMEARHGANPKTWFNAGIGEQDMPWVSLNASVQWQSFQRTIQLLRQRGNQVFVFVGPFNEHLLSQDSAERYRGLKESVAVSLAEQKIPHHIHAVLPSELYGDASHPLARGYSLMADALGNDPAFKSWRLSRVRTTRRSIARLEPSSTPPQKPLILVSGCGTASTLSLKGTN